MEKDNSEGKTRIEDLYQGCSEDELKTAEYNLKRYLSLCLKIFERSQNKIKRPNREGEI
jgi:hypothetical protein